MIRIYRESENTRMKPIKILNDVIVPVLFAIYIFVVFKVILFKFGSVDISFIGQQLQRNIEHPDYVMYRLQLGNFTPLKSISQSVQNLSSHDLINLVGNIIVFVPYGCLLPIYRNHRVSFAGAFIGAFGLSLCLECLQVVLSMGTFDVDDLLLNTLGGLLGCAAYRLVAKGRKSRAVHEER